jgi:signal peptidase II
MGEGAAAWARMVATLGMVAAVDQISKQAAVSSLERGESTNVFFGVDLVNVRNTGVAFGFLSGGGAPIVVGTALVLCALLAYFAFNASRPWLWLPVGGLLGAALGNLADRAREGAVIDFIDPVAWPAFNVADATIVVGVLGLLYVHEGPRAGRGGSGVEPGAG